MKSSYVDYEVDVVPLVGQDAIRRTYQDSLVRKRIKEELNSRLTTKIR